MSMRYPSGFISAFYNPLENPDAPTIGTATAAPGGVTIAFTAPANVGGSAITGFTAVAKRTSDGVTFTGSGASSPITVSGLTEVAFTVTVFATNSYGPSALSVASNSVTPLPAIGTAFGGGFFAGQISTTANGVATHRLVIGPLSTAETTNQWKTSNTSTSGTTSDINGPSNTAAMISAGAAAHPCAQFCNNLTIGGFSDFYMPAKNELEVCYFNLKPTTNNNQTSSGINPNAVPAKASNYTTGNPARTSAAAFQSGGAEAFAAAIYWASTEGSATTARFQRFSDGGQFSDSNKNNSRRVRAIRRVAV